MVNFKFLFGLKPSSGNLVCSHQQFIDDTMLMGQAMVFEGKSIKQLLDNYERASGQLINNQKISMFFFNTPDHRQAKIAKILGCRVDSFPATYLGLPLSLKPPESFWLSLVERFSKKLAGWKGALLSQAEKLQLFKASLESSYLRPEPI